MNHRHPHFGRASRGALLLALAFVGPWACSNATDVQLLEISGSGALFGLAYLDRDASGTLTAADRPISNANVFLRAGTATEVIDTAVTDSVGLFSLLDLPIGSYTIVIDTAVLGDSLLAVGSASPLTIAIGDTLRADLGATYPVLSLSEALSSPPGRRVFTSGIALNTRVNFGDGQVHITSGATFLRGLNVDRSGVSRGDSVRFLGRVVNNNGRPALDNVEASVLIPGAALVLPEEVTTAAANTADGGRLDAGLVRIRAAELSDTSTTVGGHFRFWADDGSDSVEVWIRAFLGLNTSTIRPDTILRIRELVGLMSPYDDGGGTVRWRVMPRVGADITLETKQADIAVTMSLDTAAASLGDTVAVRVVARNNGPLTATDLRVRDTIPTGLGLVSAESSAGAYNPGTGIWSITSLAAGSADTLTVRMEVTDGTPRSVTHVAESLGLVYQVDPNNSNNVAFVVLTIS